MGAFETAQVAFVINAMEDHIDEVVKKLMLDINYELLRTTPVDTGWARANWTLSVGSEPDNTTAIRQPGASIGSARAKQARGQARMASYKAIQGPAWISNNVPYIGRLNHGYSKQAPAGFVEAAITRAVVKNGGRPA